MRNGPTKCRRPNWHSTSEARAKASLPNAATVITALTKIPETIFAWRERHEGKKVPVSNAQPLAKRLIPRDEVLGSSHSIIKKY